MEPGGQPDDVGVVGVRLELVDAVEDGGEVRERVIAALRLLPAGEEVVGVRHGVGAADGGPGSLQGVTEAGAEGVEIGHVFIVAREGELGWAGVIRGGSG